MTKLKRLRRFVVGYPMEEEDTVWGQEFFKEQQDEKYNGQDFCRCMTEDEAADRVKQLPSAYGVIFELVPVTPRPTPLESI